MHFHIETQYEEQWSQRFIPTWEKPKNG